MRAKALQEALLCLTGHVCHYFTMPETGGCRKSRKIMRIQWGSCQATDNSEAPVTIKNIYFRVLLAMECLLWLLKAGEDRIIDGSFLIYLKRRTEKGEY